MHVTVFTGFPYKINITNLLFLECGENVPTIVVDDADEYRETDSKTEQLLKVKNKPGTQWFNTIPQMVKNKPGTGLNMQGNC